MQLNLRCAYQQRIATSATELFALSYFVREQNFQTLHLERNNIKDFTGREFRSPGMPSGSSMAPVVEEVVGFPTTIALTDCEERSEPAVYRGGAASWPALARWHGQSGLARPICILYLATSGCPIVC